MCIDALFRQVSESWGLRIFACICSLSQFPLNLQLSSLTWYSHRIPCNVCISADKHDQINTFVGFFLFRSNKNTRRPWFFRLREYLSLFYLQKNKHVSILNIMCIANLRLSFFIHHFRAYLFELFSCFAFLSQFFINSFRWGNQQKRNMKRIRWRYKSNTRRSRYELFSRETVAMTENRSKNAHTS